MCARFKRLPLGFSLFFFFLSTLGIELPLGFSAFFIYLFIYFFVDVGYRTNVFFVQEHILVKFGALRARSFNSRDKSLEGIDIVACMGVAVLACACVRAGSALPFVPFIARRAGT